VEKTAPDTSEGQSNILDYDLRLYRPPGGEFKNARKIQGLAHGALLDCELRAQGFPRLLIVVAGYKPSLWPITLQRLKTHVPPQTDICVVAPGKHVPELAAFCTAAGWSHLATRENRLSLAQNIAIEAHPTAKLIHKVDEDIVVSEGYCETLEAVLIHADRLGECDIGFVAPTLNVNGFSYRTFLKFIAPEMLDEFKRQFGDARTSCVRTAAWANPLAAQFLWEQILPFDNTAARFRARPVGYDVCPHRFSIGAMLFRRRIWDEIGGFSIASERELGIEEADLCAFCCDQARLMLVSHQTLAGHVGFFPQTAHMLRWIAEHPINQALAAKPPAAS